MTRSRHREHSVAIQSYKFNIDANHWIVTLLWISQRRLTKLKLSAMLKVSSLEGPQRRLGGRGNLEKCNQFYSSLALPACNFLQAINAPMVARQKLYL